MRILKKVRDELVVKVESSEDYLLLKRLLEPQRGREVYLVTTIERKVKIGGEEEKGRVVRKVVRVKILVSDVELFDVLRVKGKIVESGGRDFGISGVQGVSINLFDVITVEKKWKKYEILEIEKSSRRFKRILALVFDSSDATFGIIEKKIRVINHLDISLSSKRSGVKAGEQIEKLVLRFIELFKSNSCSYGMIGTQFTWKDRFSSLLEEKNKEIFSKCVFDGVSGGEKSSINELIKRGAIEKIEREHILFEQEKIVEGFFMQIAKDGPVDYGLKQSREAIKNNQVKELIICDELLAQKDKDGEEARRILDLADDAGIKIYILDAGEDAGKRFMGLSGIGVVKWY